MFSLLSSANSAEILGTYQQSGQFYSILSAIDQGTGSIEVASRLLENTYGHPEGLFANVRYLGKFEPEESTLQLREFRLDGVGYAYSSNPIQPRLFGWGGIGPEMTLGFRFVEVYASQFWAKRVDAASTDLIDRKLVESEILRFVGLGYRDHFDFYFTVPVQLDIRTRHSYFVSNHFDGNWYHHWNANINADLNESLSTQFLFGNSPVPGFLEQGQILDYLFKTEVFSDPLTLVGVGVTHVLPLLPHSTLGFGYYGGYLGGEIRSQFSNQVALSVHSYGIETTAAYHAQEIRLWGASLHLNL